MKTRHNISAISETNMLMRRSLRGDVMKAVTCTGVTQSSHAKFHHSLVFLRQAVEEQLQHVKLQDGRRPQRSCRRGM